MTKASILDFGIAFPALRLPAEALAAAWGRGAGRGLRRKPFLSFDEDVISLAIAAARIAMEDADKAKVGALYVGSTSLPYEEKPASATIVTAVVGAPRVRTVEVRGSCQAGLQALALAAEYVHSHPQSTALAIATDAPEAAPSANLDHYFSAGAVAFLVGAGDGLATIDADAGVTIETFGSRFRRFGERLIGDLELRTAELPKAIAALKGSFPGPMPAFLALGSSPDVAKSFHRAFGGKADDLWPTLGDAGAACAPIALAEALENAAVADMILAAAIGGGATALQVTRSAKPLPKRRRIAELLAGGVDADYIAYLKHRRLIGGRETASS